jgi:hypothetical protein
MDAQELAQLVGEALQDDGDVEEWYVEQRDDGTTELVVRFDDERRFRLTVREVESDADGA